MDFLFEEKIGTREGVLEDAAPYGEKDFSIVSSKYFEGKESICLFEPIDFSLFTLYKRNIQDIEFEIISADACSPVRKALKDKSDLLPNEYEGGLKTWDCSYDLVKLILDTIQPREMRILELGCGSGLPGIACLKLGNFVDFQDFNEQVIDHVTVPNCITNSIRQPTETELTTLHNGVIDVKVPFDHITRLKSRFFYGSWSKLASVVPSGFYDLIITSETLYNASNYKSLLNIMDSALLPDGRMLIAAKRYYFGLDGSTAAFLSFLEKDNRFIAEKVSESADSIPREIFSVKRK